MNSAYLKFLKHILVFTLIPVSIALIVWWFFPKINCSPALPFLFPFFIASSLISYSFLLKSMKKKFIRFVNAFLLTTTIKLFLYISVMIVYVLMHRNDAFMFILSFFILYLFYTVFEVTFILKPSKDPDA